MIYLGFVEPKKDSDTLSEEIDTEEIVLQENSAEISEETVAEIETEEENEEEELRVCPHCGNTTVAKGHEYCYMCEDALLKTKIPFTNWVVALVLVATSLFAFMMTCLLSAPALQSIKGDVYASQKNWFSAYENYADVSEVLTEITDIVGDNAVLNPLLKTGCGLDERTFKAVTHVYDPLQAYSYASKVFTSNSNYMMVSRSYAKCEKYYSEYEAAYNSIADAMSIIQEVETPTVKDGEKALALMEEARGREGVKELWLDYFMMGVADYCTMGEDIRYGYLEDMHKAAGKDADEYSWLYYQDYIDMLIATGREEEAVPFIETLMDDDLSEYFSRTQMLKVYFKRGDFESAQDLVDDFCRNNLTTDEMHSDSNYSLMIIMARVKGNYEEAAELVETADSMYSLIPEFDRQMALVYLLQGDYDQAFESAYAAEEKAYNRSAYYGDYSGYTNELHATVYVAAMMCQQYGECNTENASNLQEVLDYYAGTETETQMADIVNGKVSLESVLTEGVYDLV